MREQGLAEIASEHSIDDMAKEYLKLQRSPLMSILRILSMHLLVNPSNSISISHFDLGKVLILDIEPLLEVGDVFPPLLELLYLIKQAV
jgi:hypothetical protein